MNESPDVLVRPTVSLAAALRVVEAARGAAERIGVAVCVAVVDCAGDLLAYARMDGAPLMSGRIAQDKAYTVAAFNGLPTESWWPLLKDEPPLLHGIVKTDRLMIFGGGVPLTVGGIVVGAVGVSGGSTEQDVQVATTGAAALADRDAAGAAALASNYREGSQ